MVLIGLIFVLYASAVHRYGNFELFGSPHRVYFGGYRYDNQSTYVTLTGKDKPLIEISSITDKIVGKRIYSTDKNYIGHGRVVYLQIDGDEYLALNCGGL
jgi:hypothetical protein